MIFLLLWKMVDSSDEEARTWTLAEHQKWQTHFCYDYEFFIKKSKREKSASEEYKKEFRVKNYLELHNLNFAMQEDLDNIDEWGLKWYVIIYFKVRKNVVFISIFFCKVVPTEMSMDSTAFASRKITRKHPSQSLCSIVQREL